MKIRLLTSIIFLFLAYQSIPAQGLVRSFYVKVPEENLRSAPNSKKIGALIEGAETTILVEKDSWAKVQVTGWIWKPSLTTVNEVTTR